MLSGLPVNSIPNYLAQIAKALKANNATEHTHRPALKLLIESRVKGVVATNEPKRTKCGAPDFVVTRGEIPIGYVEAKDVGKTLDEVEKQVPSKRGKSSDRRDRVELRIEKHE